MILTHNNGINQVKGAVHLLFFCNTVSRSGPITSWKIDGDTVETGADFIFGSSKITVDGDAALKLKDVCSLKEKL